MKRHNSFNGRTMIPQNTRAKVRAMLTSRWISADDIADRLRLARNTVSGHLTLLCEAGVAEKKVEGWGPTRQIFYRTNPDGLKARRESSTRYAGPITIGRGFAQW